MEANTIYTQVIYNNMNTFRKKSISFPNKSELYWSVWISTNLMVNAVLCCDLLDKLVKYTKTMKAGWFISKGLSSW